MAHGAWGDMVENWLTQALTIWWVPALIAYILGILTHWGVSRQAHEGSGEFQKSDQRANALADSATPNNGAPSDQNNQCAPSEVQLDAIEAEIQQAKTLLVTEQRQHEALDERLSAVDAAVKRANGRLKLALRSINNKKNAN